MLQLATSLLLIKAQSIYVNWVIISKMLTDITYRMLFLWYLQISLGVIFMMLTDIIRCFFYCDFDRNRQMLYLIWCWYISQDMFLLCWQILLEIVVWYWQNEISLVVFMMLTDITCCFCDVDRYHRVLKKEKLKHEKKALEELEKNDPTAYQEKLEDVERQRIEVILHAIHS